MKVRDGLAAASINSLIWRCHAWGDRRPVKPVGRRKHVHLDPVYHLPDMAGCHSGAWRA